MRPRISTSNRAQTLEQWLVQVDLALEDAARLTLKLGHYRHDSAEATAIRTHILALRTEIDSLRHAPGARIADRFKTD